MLWEHPEKKDIWRSQRHAEDNYFIVCNINNMHVMERDKLV
uniref:Uncharacterized protein n=1 Tax=Arundo donax TaxID=35708 RepID=A0A0A9C3A6_ARUDO